MRMISKTPLVFIISLPLLVNVHGRYLLPNHASEESVSDGVEEVDDHSVHPNTTSSYLLLKGIDEDHNCDQIYGFLPCTNNIFGNLFLILVYGYILFHGESYLSRGTQRIFKILGPGIFGATAFNIIPALPESLILLVPVLLVKNGKIAEEYAMIGIGSLAGSSILLLTIVWGTCVITGSKDFEHSHGITIDLETKQAASNMLGSTILLQLSYGTTTLQSIIGLIFASLLLFFYFTKQVFEPWRQKRRLEYLKHDDLMLRILSFVEKNTLQRILTKNGTPNVSAIRRLYREIDEDRSSGISASELRDLLLQNKVTDTSIDEEKEIEEVLKFFDHGHDQMITKDEFVVGFAKWLDQTKHDLDKEYLSRKSMKDLYEVFGPWTENKRKEREGKKQIISKILRHVQNDMVGNLLRNDGKPDEIAIKRLFEKIDRNKDNCVSQSELKELMMNIAFVKASMEVEKAVALVIDELDHDIDQIINEEEFVAVFEKSLNKISSHAPFSDSDSEEDIYQAWEEAGMVVENKESKAIVDKSIWGRLMATTNMVLGIVIICIVAQPLMESVRKFSNSLGVHAAFVSFVLVPLAINAREATTAIKKTSYKNSRTISLAISEIYGGVLMNNIVGFFAISIMIYVRQVTHVFPSELMVATLVCQIISVILGCHYTFSPWSCVYAYFAYFFSLVLSFCI
ncbi:sodium/calcium exchanger NCL2 isoform X3 [Arachis hypogaea]|uniref:sodium/calcium exchanger NCL2 isoform X3 n=1 Tax=Arachis hypogaea TaxID=3818 RepID=UPI000DEC4992|nr:sodium/calcium exchanger NCL isoform X3 [Arachis hypogaea]